MNIANTGNHALLRPDFSAPPPRPRNREATIRAVLESAQRLFMTKGYDHTSLVDIAGETGLSPRGVILHFSSKADIVAELMIRDMRRRAQEYPGEEGGRDAVTDIAQFFRWLAAGDRRMFLNFAALWSFSARWSPQLEETVQRTTRELLAPVLRIVERGVTSGELRSIDAAVACETLWIAYMAGLRRAAVRNGAPSDALVLVERTLMLLRA